jgi:hypothetical protein
VCRLPHAKAITGHNRPKLQNVDEIGALVWRAKSRCATPDPQESARDAPRMRKYRRAARLGCNGARWSARSSTAVTTGFVRGHRAPVTTNNRRLHRDPHHRCTRMCKRSNLPPVLQAQSPSLPKRCQIQGLFCSPWVLLPAGYLLGVPKFSLWGPKIGAASGCRGMFGSNESTATAAEAQVYCL